MSQVLHGKCWIFLSRTDHTMQQNSSLLVTHFETWGRAAQLVGIPKVILWHSQESHAVRFPLLLRVENQERNFRTEPVSRILCAW